MNFYWFADHPHIAVKLFRAALEWDRGFVNELKLRQVNAVLDIGANSGQYAAGLRAADFHGRIVSFEPLSGPYSRLASSAASDPRWDCRQCAVGDCDGTILMNVAGNAGGGSSVLPMTKRHQEVLPSANYVRTEVAPMCRLDTVAPQVLRPHDVAFLKVDVQGFEKQVIAGGKSTVNDRCAGMQLELSFEPLYEGGMLVAEALDLAYSLGFRLRGFAPFFLDVHSGRVLQADGIFFRTDD